MLQFDLWQENTDIAKPVESKELDLKMGNALIAISSQLDCYQVKAIEKKRTHSFLLDIHYARRIPPISFAFGLFENDDLVGVITYGMPASPSLCKGICGKEYKDMVIELNRLCLLNNKKGEASRLVGASLRLLPNPRLLFPMLILLKSILALCIRQLILFTLEALNREQRLLFGD